MNGIDLKKIKKPKDFTEEEFDTFKEKLSAFKPLNDKEWELFIKLKDEIDKDSHIIGVNFYSKTINFVKTEDGWKGISEARFERMRTNYNKLHRIEPTKEIRVEPFGKTEVIWCCLIFIFIIALILLFIFIINVIEWERFWDIVFRNVY